MSDICFMENSYYIMAYSSEKINTLILVHRKQLLDQWVERITQFLVIPKKILADYVHEPWKNKI